MEVASQGRYQTTPHANCLKNPVSNFLINIFDFAWNWKWNILKIHDELKSQDQKKILTKAL
jgi:hypothetical protein